MNAVRQNRQEAALAAPETARSPERQKLAETLALVEATRSRRDEVRAAVRMAEDMVSAASSDLTKAEDAIEAAKVAMRDSISAAAMRGEGAPTSTALREARLSEAEAQDRLTAAKEALAEISAPLPDWEEALAERTKHIDREREAIAAGAVAGVIEALEPLKYQVARLAVILRAIADADGHGNYDSDTREAMRRAQTVANLFTQLPLFATAIAEARTSDPIVRGWIQALERLRIDPDVPLPALAL